MTKEPFFALEGDTFFKFRPKPDVSEGLVGTLCGNGFNWEYFNNCAWEVTVVKTGVKTSEVITARFSKEGVPHAFYEMPKHFSHS